MHFPKQGVEPKPDPDRRQARAHPACKRTLIRQNRPVLRQVGARGCKIYRGFVFVIHHDRLDHTARLAIDECLNRATRRPRVVRATEAANPGKVPWPEFARDASN